MPSGLPHPPTSPRRPKSNQTTVLTPKSARARGESLAMLTSTTDDFSHHSWFTAKDATLLSTGQVGNSRNGSGASTRSTRMPQLTEVTALTSGRQVGGVSYSKRDVANYSTPQSSSLASGPSKPHTTLSTSVFRSWKRNREAEEATLLQEGRRQGGTDNLYYVIPSGPMKEPLTSNNERVPLLSQDPLDNADPTLVEDLTSATPSQQRLMEPIYADTKTPSSARDRRRASSAFDLTVRNLATILSGGPTASIDQALAATAIVSAKMRQAMAEAQLVANEGGARMRLSILNAIPNVMPTFAALQSLVRETFSRMSIAEASERESIIITAQKELYLINEHEKAVAILERERMTAELVQCSKSQKEISLAFQQLVSDEQKQRKSFEVREERVRSTQVRLWRKMQTDVVIAERLVALLSLEDQRRFKFSELEVKHRRRIIQQVSEEVLNVRSVNPMGLCPFYDGDDCPFTPDEGAHGQCISHGHYRRLPAVLEARFVAITNRSAEAGRERQKVLELHRSSIVGNNVNRRSLAHEEDGRDDMSKPIFVREVKHFHKLMKALDEDIVASDNTKGTTLRRLLRHE